MKESGLSGRMLPIVLLVIITSVFISRVSRYLEIKGEERRRHQAVLDQVIKFKKPYNLIREKLIDHQEEILERYIEKIPEEQQTIQKGFVGRVISPRKEAKEFMLGVIEYDFFQYTANEIGSVNQFITNIMQFAKVVDDIPKGGGNLETYAQSYQVLW